MQQPRILLSSLALLCALLAAAPETLRAQEDTSQEAPERTIEVDSDLQSDAAIARRVRSIFEEFDQFGEISVTVTSGVVVLGGTAIDAKTAEEAGQLAGRVEGVVAVRNEIDQDTSVEEKLTPVLDRLAERIDRALNLLPLLAIALLVFLLFVAFGLWIASREWLWSKLAPNAFIADLIQQIVKIGFIAAGLVVALDILGAAALLGTMLGAAGIVGLAVGFAVRDTIENYVASIMLSLRQPFRPNDHVQIDSFEGHVIRLTSRATILMTMDGNHLRIPNTMVFKGVVLNFTRNPERRFEFRLGVDADENLKRALDIGLATIRDLGFVLADPEPMAWVEDVGDSNVVLCFSGWIDQRESDFFKSRSEAIRLTKRALEEADVALPEPIFRLRLDERSALPLPAVAPSTQGPKERPEPETGSSESGEVGDTKAEPAVEDKVKAERSTEQSQDLLDPSAPTE